MSRLIVVIFLALLLAGCGQEQENREPVNLDGASVLWQGYVYEDAELSSKFNDTMNCLSGFNIRRDGSPYVVLVTKSFYCGDVRASGCYTPRTDTIYAIKSESGEIFSFEHETTHWATGLGVEGHDSVYFLTCAVKS